MRCASNQLASVFQNQSAVVGRPDRRWSVEQSFSNEMLDFYLELWPFVCAAVKDEER